MTAPIAVRVRIAAPVDAVLHALTDLAQLRAWFAEHVDVDLPHRYEFWGRDIPWRLRVDARVLRFSWRLPHDVTTAEIGLQAEPDGCTVVQLSQTRVGDPVTRETMHAFWTLALANLIDHLDGRRPTCRCDYTAPEMRMDVVIAAPASAVYESILATDQVIRSPAFRHGVLAGQKLNLDPNRKVTIEIAGLGVTTFQITGTDGDIRLTLIERPSEDAQPPYVARARALSTLAEVRRFHERSPRRRSPPRRWRFAVDSRHLLVNEVERPET